jgi:ATP-dependent protease ClpP protease subunit
MIKMFKGLFLAAFISSTAYAEKVQLDAGVVLLRGVVDSRSVSSTIEGLLSSDKEEITLVIDSPGGSVFAGLRLVDTIQSSDKKIKCVILNAASMAFALSQVCTTRLVAPSAIMMQHQIAGGFEGELPKIKALLDFVTLAETRMNKLEADRMGLSPEKWAAMHIHEYWMDGTKAVKMNAADDLAQVSCSKELIAQNYKETVPVFMGITAEVTWSGCPLLISPRKVELQVGGKTVKVSSLSELSRKAYFEQIEKVQGMYDTRRILTSKMLKTK